MVSIFWDPNESESKQIQTNVESIQIQMNVVHKYPNLDRY